MLCIDQIQNHDVVESVRLHGGSSSQEGIIGMLLDESWVTICSYRYDKRTADVVCRQLGYKRGAQEVVITDRFDYTLTSIPKFSLNVSVCRCLQTAGRSARSSREIYQTVRIDCRSFL